ncbi:MAG: hypothetical protein ACJ8AT_18395, partial [Hyalangium sp.]|uniref:hypothetical protein n=1 Tax=Hyalangium sp. TaxID=2028555 RepID=UPI00389A055C
ESLQPLSDELFGWVVAPHPGDLPQMPLFVSASPPQPAIQAVLGVSRVADESSAQALIAALRRHAESGAPDVMPVLELSTGESMRVPRQPWLAMVAGDSYGSWLEEGLRQCLLRHISHESELGLEVKAARMSLDKGLSGEAALSWKTLSLRQGRRVAVYYLSLPAVPGFHAVAVVEGENTLGLAAALDFNKALEEALLEAIARVQLETSTPRLPERPSLRRHVEQATATQAVSAPASSRDGVLAALERAGLRVLVHPWLAEPGVRSRGLLLGWVGLHAR